jgi:transcriptional regulator with XRE-family HTH domain
MSTKLNDTNTIIDSFNSLFDSLSDQEKMDNEAKLIMFRFLDIVERKREELGWTRKQFAGKVGTSASYITQLMRGDKLINMTTLAKMQKVLGVQFDISELKSTEDHKVNFDVPKVGKNGFWVFKKFNPDYDSNEPIPNPDKQEIAA